MSRIPPQAIDVEQMVLGSMMIEYDAALTAIDMLRADDFFNQRHALLFGVIVDMFNAELPFGLIEVEQRLKKLGKIDAVGSDYLNDLLRSVSSTGQIEYFCQILVEKSLKRKAIQAARTAEQEAFEPTSDAYDVLDHMDQALFDIQSGQRRDNSRSMAETVQSAVDHLLSIQGANRGVTGISTGLDIDQLTAGFQNQDLVIVAGRPSMGKTAFVLECIKAMAKDGNACGVLSLEMGHRSLGQRLLIAEAGINGQRARKGMLGEEEKDKIVDAAGKLYGLDIFFDDTSAMNITQMRTIARKWKKKHDIKALFMDYLQLATGTGSEGNREQEIAAISRAMKGIAKELDIPVIALSQLSRSCESRSGWGKRPQLSDLRESGAIEQDADVVMFLFRPEYYELHEYPNGDATAGICEILVSKQRNGPVGMKRLYYDKDTMRFSNLQATPMSRPGGTYNDDPF